MKGRRGVVSGSGMSSKMCTAAYEEKGCHAILISFFIF